MHYLCFKPSEEKRLVKPLSKNYKGICFCLDCGHTWRDKEDKADCKSPHCGMDLKLENSRKRTAIYKEYFCVLTTYKRYQVIRFFMVDCRLKKGFPASFAPPKSSV